MIEKSFNLRTFFTFLLKHHAARYYHINFKSCLPGVTRFGENDVSCFVSHISEQPSLDINNHRVRRLFSIVFTDKIHSQRFFSFLTFHSTTPLPLWLSKKQHEPRRECGGPQGEGLPRLYRNNCSRRETRLTDVENHGLTTEKICTR